MLDFPLLYIQPSFLVLYINHNVNYPRRFSRYMMQRRARFTETGSNSRPSSRPVVTLRSQLSHDFKHDYLFKVLICGDTSVGKTSVLNRFVSDKFRVTHIRTIGQRNSILYAFEVGVALSVIYTFFTSNLPILVACLQGDKYAL